MRAQAAVSERCVELRPAGPADEQFLGQLFGTTRRDVAALGWAPEVLEAFLASQYEAQSQHYRGAFPGAFDQIVVESGEPIGRLLIDRSGGVTRIVDIALLPTHRGMGIGEHLLRAVCQRAAQEDSPVRLSVAVGNPAEKLYGRLGFVDTGGDPVYRTMEWRAA